MTTSELYNKNEFSFDFGGKKVTVETGRLAKQADGAVLVSSLGTQVLVTVVSAREMVEGQDFFPLLVDYKEKFYAAGKFLGGFMKREARPSNSEILLMRMVDRPLRPLFPEGYMYETIIMASVLSYDPAADPQVLAGLGASAALVISDIPFAGPMSMCKVGRLEGKLVLNPTEEELKSSDLEMVVAGTSDAILMVEGQSEELSEKEMLESIQFAHKEIKGFCDFLKEIQKKVGKTKREFIPLVPNKTLLEELKKDFLSKVEGTLKINAKQERQLATSVLKKEIAKALEENPSRYALKDGDKFSAKAGAALDELLYTIMRSDILDNSNRIGQRSLTQVRPIKTEVDVLDRVHGSSLFTRGETQVLAAVTLGGKEGEQMSDAIKGISYEKFYLHYMFPPFSVGEARGYRGVSRREIGHGNLAERAIRMVLPDAENFPYTVRINCEVLESNGSSSMASVCSGCMALMDAGVKVKAPVAGVAMGLIKEGEKYAILTDILGDEDHLGDMDFKVAGTEKGITAIQMDIKISGLNDEILEKALAQAKDARLHILNEMRKGLEAPRADYKEGVPQIVFTKIPSDKIGALIGPGGKNIKMLQEDYSVVISVDDDGKTMICGTDNEKLAFVQSLIDLQINGPVPGKVYEGRVVSIKEYGAFVDIAPNLSGLLHVSEIANERVQDVKDYLDEDDIIEVKVLEVDRFGKIKLSRKALASLEKKVR